MTTRRHRSLTLIAATTLALGLTQLGVAGPEGTEPKKKAKPPAMQFETYSLVFLRAGPNRKPATRAELIKIQRAHLGHLTQMAKAGKMVIAGPLSNQPDKTLRGICLYRVPLAEAKRLASSDPAVKAGRLKVEVQTWWVEKGHMTFPKAPAVKKKAP